MDKHPTSRRFAVQHVLFYQKSLKSSKSNDLKPSIKTIDAGALKCLCNARLSTRPTEQVYSAAHVPARGDHDLNGGQMPGSGGGSGPKPAAVLVPIIERADGLSILLTQRQKNLNSHGGQICFPGGKVEKSDCSRLSMPHCGKPRKKSGLAATMWRCLAIATIIKPLQDTALFLLLGC